MSAHTPDGSPLGRDTAYPSGYDPGQLYPIPRAPARGCGIT